MKELEAAGLVPGSPEYEKALRLRTLGEGTVGYSEFHSKANVDKAITAGNYASESIDFLTSIAELGARSPDAFGLKGKILGFGKDVATEVEGLHDSSLRSAAEDFGIEAGIHEFEVYDQGEILDTVSIEFYPREIHFSDIIIYQDSLQGDVNFDFLVNVTDIIAIISHIIEYSLLDNEQLDYADLNSDGNINVSDIVQLVNNIIQVQDQNPDFSLIDINPSSSYYNTDIGPSYFNGQVSCYYFGKQG